MVKLAGVCGILLLNATGCSRLATSSMLPAAPAADHSDRGDAIAYKTIFWFSRTDGAIPSAALLDVNGRLFGTTFLGGKAGCGVVFSIDSDGKDERVIHDFSENEGCGPLGLVYSTGSFYGIANRGATDNDGSVFRMHANGGVIWSSSLSGNPGGANPEGGPIYYRGSVYGTTSSGGSGCPGQGCGTVFKADADGNTKIIYNFRGEQNGKHDGQTPMAGLVELNGLLYGTTCDGGADDRGTIFTVTTSGGEKVRHSFSGADSNGFCPQASLIVYKGNLYGTTTAGGDYNFGTVFSYKPGGSVHAVWSFGNGDDGKSPRSSLVEVNGELYGTTGTGGNGTNCSGHCGTIFELSLSGHERVLHNFQRGKDGALPMAGLLFLKGKLYGTTSKGGSDDLGTLFTVTP